MLYKHLYEALLTISNELTDWMITGLFKGESKLLVSNEGGKS